MGDAVRVILVLTLVVVLGIGLLYAYRSQTPAIQTIPMTQAISDIQTDRVDEITLMDDRAMMTLVGGGREQTMTGGNADALLQVVTEYNRAKPGRSIGLRYEYSWYYRAPLLGVVLGFLPLLFLIALVLVAAYAFARSRRGDAYEQLARIAELRDRGVLTEEEFQREKRRLLR